MSTKTLYLSIVLIFSVLLSACGTAVAQEQPKVTRTVSVNGSAQAFLDPDIAYVTIGVHTENANAATAVEENNAQAAAVIDMLKQQGIAEKDIRTTSFNIFPATEYTPEGESKGTYYIVENSVTVTIRDLAKIGDLLDAVVDAGANSVAGIQFDVEDKDAALAQARAEAIGNAREMAEELATAAGVTVGEIQTISYYGGYPSPIYMQYDQAARAEVAASVPVNPGQLTLTVDVSIVYEIQ